MRRPIDPSVFLSKPRAAICGTARACRRLFSKISGFTGLCTSLVEAGELTGHLRQAIADAAAQMETANRLAKEIRNALVYPAVLVFSGVAAVLFIFVFVVPRFTVMVKNREDSLPWLSKVVLNTGGFFNAHWAVLAGGVCVGSFSSIDFCKYRPRAPRFMRRRCACRLPDFGSGKRRPVVGPACSQPC